MPKTVEQCCDEWVEFRLGQEMESLKSRMDLRGESAETWVAENTTTIENFKARMREEWKARAEEIRTRNEEFCKGATLGRFHPSNRYSRELFTAVTGIALPPQVEATRQTIRQYARTEMEAFQKAREREATEKRAIEQKKECERQEKILQDLRDRVSADKPIDGEGLVLLAKSLGIEIPIQSIGMFRRRILEVNSFQARYTGAGKLKAMSHFRIYRRCQETLKGNPATAQ